MSSKRVPKAPADEIVLRGVSLLVVILPSLYFNLQIPSSYFPCLNRELVGFRALSFIEELSTRVSSWERE